MMLGSMLLLALLQAPPPAWDAPAGVVQVVTPVITAESLTTHRASTRLAVDTPVVRRPRAIEYSDWYFTRLTIHRYGSYAMLPLFAAEYSLGQNLINDASPPGWMKPSHGVVAGGIGVLFGLNTITGVWNLWDSRQDPNGRTRRILHSALMLASDAGFLAAGMYTPSHEDFIDYASYRHRVNVHKGLAIGSIALSTIGGGMMWFWKQ